MLDIHYFIKLNYSSYSNILFDLKKIGDYINVYNHDTMKQSNIYQTIGTIDSFDISDNNFTTKFLLTIDRTLGPYLFFELVYYASNIVKKSSSVVDINIVNREDNKNSLFYNNIQMKIIKYFKDLYKIKISLHSGELTHRLTRLENLNHISTAIEISDRIGHGVDIIYEPNPLNIINKMRNEKIAVEINLLSNDFLLGVKPSDNPVRVYLKHKVPVVISSDDPGIFLTTLSEQYYLLTKNFNLTFLELKNIIYNGINYSFLDEADKKKQIGILDEKFRIFIKMYGKYLF